MSHVENFTTAQYNLLVATMVGVQCESDRQDAFKASAITTAEALASKGVTLKILADANRFNNDVAKELGAPKGTLYVSVQGVQFHGQAGQILALPVGEGDAPVPTSVQALIVKATRKKVGVKDVNAAIRKGTQLKAIAHLESMIAKADDAKGEGEGSGEGEGDEGASNVIPIEAGQTVSTLIARLMAMVAEGATLSDADLANLSTLTTDVAAAA